MALGIVKNINGISGTPKDMGPLFLVSFPILFPESTLESGVRLAFPKLLKKLPVFSDDQLDDNCFSVQVGRMRSLVAADWVIVWVRSTGSPYIVFKAD